jgi:3-hydroxy acid dehydrogenase/malonic semialdehyde reductase
MRLHHKTILITGATSGYGKAILHMAFGEGARVIAAGRSAAKLDALMEEYKDAPLHPLLMDVTDKQAVQNAIASLPAEWTAIDALVNNAGLALGLEPAHRASLEEWDTMVATNINGVMNVTHAILPGMVARGRGHIVNMGSMAGTYPYPGGNAYGATKAFVKQFSLNLRADLLGTGVRVTNVEPGMSAGTEFSVVRFGGDRQKAAEVYAGAEPLLPEDVAECVVWALSQPEHVCISRLEVMPTGQATGPLAVWRN